MDGLKPPKPFTFDGNIAEKWKQWKNEFEWYLVATESDTKTEKVRAGILLHVLGSKGREIYDTLTFAEPDDKVKYTKIVEQLEAYCIPRKNITLQRFKFLTHRQGAESFDEFVTELKKQSKLSDLGTLTDSLIKDMIIIGTKDRKLQERLLRKETITLEEAIKAGQATEVSRKHKDILNSTEKSKLHADVIQGGSKQKNLKPGSSSKHKDTRNRDGNMIMNCKFCAYQHQRGRCPAYNRKCISCDETGHLIACCPNKAKKKFVKEVVSDISSTSSDSDLEIDMIIEDNDPESCQQSDEEISTPSTEVESFSNLESEESSTERNHITEEEKTLFIGEVEINTVDNKWKAVLETNHTNIEYKIDTGADANVISYEDFKSLKVKPKLNPTKVKLSAYNGTKIPVKGKCILRITHKNQKETPVLFIVADIKSTPILGHKTSTSLNLIKRMLEVKRNAATPEYLDLYKECFGELGCLSTVHHIEINEDSKPVIHPPRKVPYALLKRLKIELDKMVKMGVVKVVTKPTQWVNSMVIVEKPGGKLRICLDPKDLNKVIKRQHLKLPTTEEILDQMTGSKYYTKLDASNVYWQMKIDEESSKLLTFNTPFGRYSFQRMAYGVHSASELCQLEIGKIIEGIAGTMNSQDDIIIWGRSKQELRNRTIEVLKAVKQSGLKLNKSKCEFDMKEIHFLGHTISSEGVKADPQKITAITEMPNPTSVKELQRFLGLMNYVSKFIPKYSEITAPLRELLQKNVEWSFDKPQQSAIEELKRIITDDNILKFYDPSLPIRISCDASTLGLGAVLEQKSEAEWYPIAYASRSLTNSEKNYSQMEKEMLSIVFSCDKFHQYVYGRDFNVYNDHMPLKSIFKKDLKSAPARLQRFLMRLHKYNFTMHYIPGSKLIVADALSRAPLSCNDSEIPDEELEVYIHAVFEENLISEKRKRQIVRDTDKDSELQILLKYILEGWPKRNKDVHPEAQKYFHCREDLTYHNGLIMKGIRIVIPQDLRKEMRNILHTGHQGVINIVKRARSSMYWPNMGKELEYMSKSCETCNKYRNQQQAETRLKHDVPETPWTKVGTDCFSIKEKDYLLVVDYASKYFDVSKLKNKESETVVKATKEIFSRYGIPLEVYSDNGPEFIAKEYKDFSEEWDFNHDTSSPEYPESNGLVERTIQTVKKCMKKARDTKEDPEMALLILKTTPLNNGLTPAELMFKRPIRTILPINKPTKKTLIKKEKNVASEGRDLPELKPGDVVRFRKDGCWSRKGRVIAKAAQPRSYKIQTDKGTIIRRNRRHLLLTEEQFLEEDTEDSDSEFYQTAREDIPNARDEDNQITRGDAVIPEEHNVVNDTQDQSVRTRSGRISRPPKHLNIYER